MFEIFNSDTHTAMGRVYDNQEDAQWQIDMNQTKYKNCYTKYKA